MSDACILLVEDDLRFAHWCATVLSQHDPLTEVVAEPNLGAARQALAARPAACWRLAIIDLNLGEESGIDLIAELAATLPQLPVLVVTSVDTPDKAIRAIRAGAQGYLLKATIKDELLRSVEQACAGGSPITPSIARQLLTEFRAGPVEDKSFAPAHVLGQLSQRETEVLRLLARGYSNKEVGTDLDISMATVDSHVRNIYQKLQVNSRAELRRMLS